ncbi:hypothetical protein MNV_660031 [Candidatus Methanoperedens nitroreducens]|uniref:Uncharacterized protein n=1 Tax=Candidatus Methanoperedens nitratireducens TaxID=1392998 RepID=A0A284VSY1_9EURY|nr:hypothetical protein MNV_660031 [Candidatus Methanoperedens nitroreducens]
MLPTYFALNRTIDVFGKNAPLLLLLSILLTAGHVNAEIPDGHKPIPCIGCHQETLGANAGDIGEEICGNCHYYKLDVSKLEAEHNPKICKACHMGNTIANGSEKEIFHNGHSAVRCTRCHTEDDFTIIKIKSDGFRCVSCHGTQVHSIHVKNLGKACPICHGSWAAGKVYRVKEASSLNKPEEVKKYEGFTAFHIIKTLINMLLGIK